MSTNYFHGCSRLKNFLMKSKSYLLIDLVSENRKQLTLIWRKLLIFIVNAKYCSDIMRYKVAHFRRWIWDERQLKKIVQFNNSKRYECHKSDRKRIHLCHDSNSWEFFCGGNNIKCCSKSKFDHLCTTIATKSIYWGT